MDVILIQPRIRPEAVYPLEAAALAAALKDSGRGVEGFDAFLDPESELLDRLAQSPPTAVLCAAVSQDFSETESLLRRIRSRGRARIILFGPRAGQWLSRGFAAADSTILNDPEPVIGEVLSHAELGRLDPVYDGGEADLERLPFADREVFPMRRYQAGMLVHRWPFAAMLTSRGCSRMCPHCYAPEVFRGRVRLRDPGLVAEEMLMLRRRCGVRTVLIEDEDFFASGERVLELCRILERSGDAPFWECPNGVDPGRIGPGLIEAMARSGCRGITFSVETGHEQHREFLNRRWDPERLPELLRTASRCGIRCGAYFMIGLPGETEAMIRETISMACGLPMVEADFSIWKDPRSGTGPELGAPCAVEGGKLEKMRKNAYFRFYGRPGRLIGLAARLLRRPGALPVVLARVRAKLGRP